MAYYTVLIAVSLTTHTITTNNLPQKAMALLEYFSCEQGGHNSSAPCPRSKFESFNYPVLTTLAYVLLALFPTANLVYTLNVSELRMSCKGGKSSSRPRSRSTLHMHMERSSSTVTTRPLEKWVCHYQLKYLPNNIECSIVTKFDWSVLCRL